MSLLHGRLISSRYYVRSGRDNRHIMSSNYETLSCESLFLISASSPDIPLEVWKAWKLLQPLLLFPFKLSTKQWLKCCSVLCILLRKNSMLSHGDIYSAFKNTVSVPESKYFTALTAPTHAPGSKYRTHKWGYFLHGNSRASNISNTHTANSQGILQHRKHHRIHQMLLGLS